MTDPAEKVRAVIIAGGLGERLKELTGIFRPKPLIPLQPGRLLDYAVSNAMNANGLVMDIIILVQALVNEMLGYIQEVYHVQHTSKQILGLTVPMLKGSELFEGTADAVRKTKRLFDGTCGHLLVLAGDHLCQIDFAPIIKKHLASSAPCTVLVQRVPCNEAAGRFGVFTVDATGKVIAFTEKPQNPDPIPGTDNMCLASLGMYLFHAETLEDVLNNKCPEGHDFGKDIIPDMLERGEVRVEEYNGYWRDLGTPLAYHEACMDLLGPTPAINLYDRYLPIIHEQTRFPGAKLYGDCRVVDSVVEAGSRIGGYLFTSVCGVNAHFSEGSEAHRSLILDNTVVKGGVRLVNTIVDIDCVIGEGVVLGENIEEELQRYPQIRAYEGIIVVPHHTVLTVN